MKRLFVAVLGNVVFLLLANAVVAQEIPDPAPVRPVRTEVEDYIDSIGRSRISPELTHEPRVLTKGLLAPSETDRLAFADFLKSANSGLIRLMPRELYDNPRVETNHRVPMSGGGAYYSFAWLRHLYGYGSDIELQG